MLWRDHDDEVVLYEVEGSMYGVGMVFCLHPLFDQCNDQVYIGLGFRFRIQN
jgi:hypothetical protein